MIITEYNEEWAMAAQREDGFAEGFEKSREETAKKLLTTNLSLKEIAFVVGWSEEKVLEFAQKAGD